MVQTKTADRNAAKNKTGHTPGPWVAVGSWVEHPNDAVADICICDPSLFEQGYLGRTDAEKNANACLVAAAPDMLAALDEALRAADLGYEPPFDLLNTMRAVVAKARGEG